MPEKPKSGCLGFFLELFGFNLPSEPDSAPYQLKSSVLTKTEHHFYRALKSAVGESLTILMQVRMADYLRVRPGVESPQKHRNRIQQKSVDFLLCHPDTLKPILAIELDDKTHEQPKRVTRDRFVDRAYKSAGLPILHLKPSRAYDTKKLTDQIMEAIKPKTNGA